MQRPKHRLPITLLVFVLLFTFSLGMVAQAQDDPIQLQVTWWGSQNRHDRTVQVIEMYEAENPNIDIVYEFSNFTDYWPRVNTQAAGGQIACVMQHDYAFLSEWANRGLLAPLDPYMEEGTIDISSTDDSLLDGGRLDGQTYGISLGVNSPSIIIDAAAFEAAGLELPAKDWTWTEFEEIATTLHDELDIWAISYGLWDPQFWRGLYLSLGENAFSPDGTALGYTDDQPLIDYFNMIRRLQESGAVVGIEEATEISAGGLEASPIVTGEEAMRYQWSNQVVAIYNAAGEGRDLRLWPLPRPEGGQSENYLKPSMFFSMTSTCEHPEEAAKFINFFVNDFEANDILLAERGVPISSAVQEHLLPSLDDVGVQTFDFIAAVTEDASPIPPPDPQGWSDISSNVYDALFIQPVFYGQISVEEGVATFRTEAEAILAQNQE